ncbi:hypothetical protein YC2023_103337 [Brassica napus]
MGEPTTYMAKFGFNQLDNGRPNKLKCLGLGNWGKTRFPFFFPSPAILLLLLRFFFSFFDFPSPSSIHSDGSVKVKTNAGLGDLTAGTNAGTSS